MPALNDFPLRNLSLLDLLGVRYVLQPAHEAPASPTWLLMERDDRPEAYDMIAGGRRALPAYHLYENPNAFPRAFIVFEALPLPERAHVLAALKQTDFRRQVLLEDFALANNGQRTTDNGERTVTVTSYQPNRVSIHVDDGTPGWLVLTDVWYPGWTCTLDGQATTIHRADFLFRAVAVPAGGHEVVFTYAPAFYSTGRRISQSALATVAALTLLGLAWPRLRGRTQTSYTA